MAAVTISIPNFFVSFLAKQPKMNPFYEKIRPIAENAVCQQCAFLPAVAKVVRQANFSYFAAIMIPNASEEKFEIVCEWGNWIFPFDDLFDNGDVKNDAGQAKAIMDSLLAGFEGPVHRGTPIVRFHDRIWSVLKGNAGSEEYVKAMKDYCIGTLAQVSAGAVQDVESMLEMRRKSVCVTTLFALTQYGHELVRPQMKVVEEFETIALDLTLLHNDVLSYAKESSEGVPHNVVHAFRHTLSLQQAVDRVTEMVEERIARWDTLKANGFSNNVKEYIEALENVVKANLYWSYECERFLTPHQKSSLTQSGQLLVNDPGKTSS